MVKQIAIPAWYYQQFDADYSMEVPAEGFGGWHKVNLTIDLAHTAIVVMHAVDCGTKEQYPGWFRVVEYIERSYEICDRIMPNLLQAVRSSGMKIYHVVFQHGGYFEELPGYLRAVSLTEQSKGVADKIGSDPTFEQLREFRRTRINPGHFNGDDIRRGMQHIDFPAGVKPLDHEGIAENSDQLFALCQADKISHLIYTGFAINGCLQTSPGGMVDMHRKGLLCSTIRQAVTAIENKETARQELAKEIALWQISLFYGFVYDAEDFVRTINSM